MEKAENQKNESSSILASVIEEKDFANWMTPPLTLAARNAPRPAHFALFRVREIFAGEVADYRRALANIYAALDAAMQAALIYLLEGSPRGVALYFGVMVERSDLREARKLLISALEGQLPGLAWEEVSQPEVACRLLDGALKADQRGLMLGVPAADVEDGGKLDVQGIERLVRALLVGPDGRSGERWRLLIVAKPLPRHRVGELFNRALAISTEVALRARTSLQWQTHRGEQTSHSVSESDSLAITTGKSEQVGWNTSRSETRQRSKSNAGSITSSRSQSTSLSKQVSNHISASTATSLGEQVSIGCSNSASMTATHGRSDARSQSEGTQFSASSEFVDKKLDLLRQHLDEWLLPRLKEGYARGLLDARILLAADTPSAYQRLASVVRVTFQGTEAALSPLEIVPLPSESMLTHWLDEFTLETPSWLRLTHSFAPDGHAGVLLTPSELALIAGLPQRELPGIARRPSADFALAVPSVADEDGVRLGTLMDHGRLLPDLKLYLPRQDFNKHVFVSGVTGAGKTTSCINLLVGAQMPFLVIEPAKTEYRQLFAHFSDLRLYRPLADKQHALRINPMALVHHHQPLSSHIEFLSATLAAVFPMEASMPYLVKQAIVRAYEKRGWNVADSEWLDGRNPFDPAAQAWPTLAEMIAQLDEVIRAQKMGREFEEKYRGSLVSRLNDLTRGPLGSIFNTRQSPDWLALLDTRVVIELEEVKSGEGKALLMALLLGALAEAVKAKHRHDRGFRHLTLVEEAHRLLAEPEPQADDSRRLAVQMFADLLSEVRKYGAGLIIVDQIPSKLIPDVLKNTHIKIAHRLFAPDDRRALGEAMLMSEVQRDYLPRLAPGEALVYCGGWHMPALVRVHDRLAAREVVDDTKLETLSVQLLWRERDRYFPTLAQVDYPATDAKSFADFVREARQALNALLTLAPFLCGGKTQKPQVTAERLRDFVKRWQPCEDDQERLRKRRETEEALQRAPEGLLAAAWLACACDLVPLPRVEKESPMPLDLRLSSESWSAFFDFVVASVATSDNPLQALADPDFSSGRSHRNFSNKECLRALSYYEKF